MYRTLYYLLALVLIYPTDVMSSVLWFPGIQTITSDDDLSWQKVLLTNRYLCDSLHSTRANPFQYVVEGCNGQELRPGDSFVWQLHDCVNELDICPLSLNID